MYPYGFGCTPYYPCSGYGGSGIGIIWIIIILFILFFLCRDSKPHHGC